MKKEKIWFWSSIGFVAIALLGIALIIIIIDPFFHYHKPLSILQYNLSDERHQNDGITRNFEYDAIITGTSMTQNFKASLVDELWDAQSIKIPFSGGRYKEIGDATKRAIDRNEDIKLIIRGLDLSVLPLDKDEKPTHFTYPEYLYDDNILNDTYYILNKDVLIKNAILESVWYTLKGNKTQNFDEYNRWMGNYPNWGKETVMIYPKLRLEEIEILDEKKATIKGNIEQNVLSIAKENPDIEFFLFYPPYSIAYFDSIGGQHAVKPKIEAMRYASELMLQQENIKLFCFFDEYDMICDLNNYKDTSHYSEEINDKMLHWMKNEEHLLTKENYMEYFDEIQKFYTNFDYDAYLWDDIS